MAAKSTEAGKYGGNSSVLFCSQLFQAIWCVPARSQKHYRCISYIWGFIFTYRETSCMFTNIAALATHPRKDNDCNSKILLFLVWVIIQLGVTSAGMDRNAQKFSHCLVMVQAVCFAPRRANAWDLSAQLVNPAVICALPRPSQRLLFWCNNSWNSALFIM